MIRLLFFDIPLDKRKCGAAAGIGSAVGGLTGSFLTASSSNKIANKQIAAQQRENELNRAYQTAEAEKARQFNTSERVASQDFSREQMAWQEKMVQQQNEYNSPVNQARMLSEAGLNPAIAMQGQGTTISASPGSPAGTGAQASSPMPAGVSGLSPVSQQPLDLQVPQMVNAVASMLTGVANAKKAGAETNWIEKSMELNLRNLSADASLKEVTEAGIKLDNALKEQKLPHEVKKIIGEAFKASYDAVVSFETIGKVKNEKLLIDTQKRLNDALSKLHDTNSQLIGLDIASYWKRLNGVLQLQSAQANSANASAALSGEQKRAQQFINDMRSHFSAQEYETYVDNLMRDSMLSEAEHAEAMRRMRLIPSPQSPKFKQYLDDALEYVKSKISIFK